MGHHCTVDVQLEKLGLVPFFRQLSAEELQKVNEMFRAKHCAAGDVVYYQDEPASYLRVLVHGSVKLIQHTTEGKDILVDMLKPGEYFGSLSVLGDDHYTETAVAQSDSCILVIANREFRDILNSRPAVAVTVLDITSEKLNKAREMTRHFTTMAVEKRIAHILITLCEKFGEESKHGQLLQVPLSRKDIADMAGTSTETASRIMSRFQENGFITSGRQWVAIRDKEGLTAIMGS